MALPPIITDTPLFRMLNGSFAKPASAPQAAASQDIPEDKVILSDDALKKLDELESSDIKTADSARRTAGEVRNTLENDPDLYLGLGEESLL